MKTSTSNPNGDVILSLMTTPFWHSLPRQVWVFYHYPCNDGIFAATCAYLFFQKYSANVRFIPLTTYSSYVLEPNELQHVDTVFLLDYVPSELLEKVAKTIHTVVIDHHKTSISYFQTNFDKWSSYPLELHLDDKLSGCGLAWEYFSKLAKHFFQQNLTTETDFLPILRAVQDADLWLWKEQGSKVRLFYLIITRYLMWKKRNLSMDLDIKA